MLEVTLNYNSFVRKSQEKKYYKKAVALSFQGNRCHFIIAIDQFL